MHFRIFLKSILLRFNSIERHRVNVPTLNDCDEYRTCVPCEDFCSCQELLCQELTEGGRLRTVGEVTWVCLSFTQMVKGGPFAAQELRLCHSWTAFRSKTIKFLCNRVRYCSVVSFSPNSLLFSSFSVFCSSEAHKDHGRIQRPWRCHRRSGRAF